MTIGSLTAYRGPNPTCSVCAGSGTDPDFNSDCTECWPTEQRTAFVPQTIDTRLDAAMALRAVEFGDFIAYRRAKRNKR